MYRKLISLFFLLFVIGFSFFYTNRAVLIARKNDPIMMKIIDSEKDYKINAVNPIIINKNEYVYGINGCEVDSEKSYNKMKNYGNFDENLLFLKEDEIEMNTNNKYIISGNKEEKKVSLIFIVKEKIDETLLNYIKNKKIEIAFFIDGNFLEKKLSYVEELSKIGYIYNFGRNQKYLKKYISYDNNLINSISNNESKYCLVNKKEKNTLKICNDNDMEVIKSDFISDNILSDLKYTITNGKIIVIDNIDNNILDIKVSINYILSKGYNIINISDLLKSNKNCDIILQR